MDGSSVFEKSTSCTFADHRIKNTTKRSGMKTTPLLLTVISCCCSFVTNAQWFQKNSGTTQALQDIYFPTQSTGYAVGYSGTILKSTDAGDTWTVLNSNTNSDLQALYFLDADKGYVVGNSGMYRTADGGINWQTVPSTASEALTDITFIDAETGFCVGQNGAILKTSDGGASWTHKPAGIFKNLSNIHFPVPDTGYITVTDNNWEFLKSVDGGESWSVVPINPHLNQGSNMEALFFTSSETGYLGGWYPSAFLKTTDGGANWLKQDTTDEAQIYSIFFPKPSTGYAVGWFNRILHTQDGGSVWTPQDAGIASFGFLYSVFFVNDSTGFIAGSNGTILKTSNGGASTSGIAAPVLHDAFSVQPNPVHDLLNIRILGAETQPCIFSLYNTSGLQVLDKTVFAASTDIDLSAYPAGMYWFALKKEGNTVKTGKIVKH